jgi:hypothetical protein
LLNSAKHVTFAVTDENAFERNDVMDIHIDFTTVGSGVDMAGDKRTVVCITEQWHLAFDFCSIARKKTDFR